MALGEPILRLLVQDRLECPLGFPVLPAKEVQHTQPVVEGSVEGEPLYQQFLDLLGAHVPAPEEHQVHATVAGFLDQTPRDIDHCHNPGEGVDGLLQELVGLLLPGQGVLSFGLDQLGPGGVGGEGLALGDHFFRHLGNFFLELVEDRLQFCVKRVFVIVIFAASATTNQSKLDGNVVNWDQFDQK